MKPRGEIQELIKLQQLAIYSWEWRIQRFEDTTHHNPGHHPRSWEYVQPLETSSKRGVGTWSKEPFNHLLNIERHQERGRAMHLLWATTHIQGFRSWSRWDDRWGLGTGFEYNWLYWLIFGSPHVLCEVLLIVQETSILQFFHRASQWKDATNETRGGN